MRRGVPAAVLATAALAAASVLVGCSSSESAGSSGSASTSGASSGAGSAESEAAQVAWSPCDGVTAAQVSRLAGAAMREQDGTAGAPRCTFVPVHTGGPAYDVSYLWFADGLDAALGSMGAVARQLRPVEVPGATAARLAVKKRDSGLLVTGFVETEGLVQSVNAVQLAPYDQRQLVRSTTALLAALAREAPAPS